MAAFATLAQPPSTRRRLGGGFEHRFTGRFERQHLAGVSAIGHCAPHQHFGRARDHVGGVGGVAHRSSFAHLACAHQHACAVANLGRCGGGICVCLAGRLSNPDPTHGVDVVGVCLRLHLAATTIAVANVVAGFGTGVVVAADGSLVCGFVAVFCVGGRHGVGGAIVAAFASSCAHALVAQSQCACGGARASGGFFVDTGVDWAIVSQCAVAQSAL